MTCKTYAIGDLHLGHSKVLEYRPFLGTTVEEQAETLIENINFIDNWEPED